MLRLNSAYPKPIELGRPNQNEKRKTIKVGIIFGPVLVVLHVDIYMKYEFANELDSQTES